MAPSDQIVSSRIILATLLDLERRGAQRVMEELEQTEPDLACFVMEQCSALYHQLGNLRGRPKATQKLYHRIEDLVLICILAQRQAYRQFWANPARPEAPAGTEATANQPDQPPPAPHESACDPER